MKTNGPQPLFFLHHALLCSWHFFTQRVWLASSLFSIRIMQDGALCLFHWFLLRVLLAVYVFQLCALFSMQSEVILMHLAPVRSSNNRQNFNPCRHWYCEKHEVVLELDDVEEECNEIESQWVPKTPKNKVSLGREASR